jgi:hypothetical protein
LITLPVGHLGGKGLKGAFFPAGHVNVETASDSTCSSLGLETASDLLTCSSCRSEAAGDLLTCWPCSMSRLLVTLPARHEGKEAAGDLLTY